MNLRNEINVVEQALVDLLQLAFWRRLPPLTNLAALKARSVGAVGAGELIYITAESRLYRWIDFSTSVDDGLNVIEPSVFPTGQVKGRWHRVSSSVTYGPDSTAMLQSKPTAVCSAVLHYRGDETYEDFVEHAYGKNPCMFLKWMGDAPEPKSAGFRGSLYRNVHSFMLFLGSQCLRSGEGASWGSPIAAEAALDPGINAMIGEARFVLAGVETAVDGIEFVEIGPARQVHENLEERVFVYSLELKVQTSHTNEDLDLIPALVEVQPKWSSDAQGASGFDPRNYVLSGLELDLAAGLTQTIEAGTAIIGGVSVTSAQSSVTLAASQDTYRDLRPNGTWELSAVDVGSDPPPITSGNLRIAVTRTDAAGVVLDMWLAAHSIDLEPPIPVI